jgi:mercuric ion transport protein
MNEVTGARRDTRSSSWALGTATIAALLASSCCLVPLVLVSLGLSGAWLSNLRVLQPYSSVFIGVAVVALALAGRSLFRSTASCPVGNGVPGGIRRNPLSGSGLFYRILFWVIATLTLILLATPVVAPWFY